MGYDRAEAELKRCALVIATTLEAGVRIRAMAALNRRFRTKSFVKKMREWIDRCEWTENGAAAPE